MPLRLVVEDDPGGDNSIVGLTGDVMEDLRLTPGNHVLVRGAECRQTIGIAALQENMTGGKIRMNNVMCKNIGCRPSSEVTVCRLDGLPRGEIVSVEPFADTLQGVSIGDLDLEDSYLAPYFGSLDRPVVRGDTFAVRDGAGTVEFKVTGVDPGESCVVGKGTVIKCKTSSPSAQLDSSSGLTFTPMVSVEIRGLTGEVLLAGEDVLRSTKMSWLKTRVKRVAHQAIVDGMQTTASQTYIARGCGMKLIHCRHALVDDDTLEDEAFGASVKLTAVLFVRTYKVIIWGDRTSGGYLDPFSEVAQLIKSGVTKVFGNGRAFAALREGGQVVTWGDKACGGDSSAVEHRLSKLCINVCSNSWAFAALKEKGIVVPWGDPEAGGKADSAIARQLSGGVVKLFSSECAFVALKESGSIVAWGNPDYGGDASVVAEKLRGGVAIVHGNTAAFVAVKESGEVVAWGDPESGGDADAVAHELQSGVATVYGNGLAFAALKESGCVVAWGSARHGGDLSAAADSLETAVVVSLHSNKHAFAALTEDGSVITWGDPEAGGDSSFAFAAAEAEGPIGAVTSITCNEWAFAALTDRGAVICWGDPLHGGDAGKVADQLLAEIQSVVSNDWAFAALTKNGAVITWGDSASGGDAGDTAEQLMHGIAKVHGNGRTFAALTEGGGIVAWGESSYGGDVDAVKDLVSSGVVAVHGGEGAFAALKEGGAVVTWGNRMYGGASSTVETKGWYTGNTLKSVAEELESGVNIVHSNGLCFAALKEMGCDVV
eukprot:TRINITY_DN57259_c0_g1_i1.p1 TRINITY_DN57259_c0_g1~~TRINITY_DN57259_c0_g1_i1.p1  ORF type:complete len:771 (-),score=139.75 TRINITY_DN57259_c0_g1_i1:80-2392(-)